MKKLSFFLMAMLVSLTSFAAALGEGYSKVTDITTLSAGDKVVLYCDDAELGVTGQNGNKDATVAAEGWVEYVVEAADGGVLLKDGEQYVALTAKNRFDYNATGNACKVSAAGVLYITLDGTDYYLYENASGDTKYYRMYTDKTGTSYEASYKPFYVYKVVAEQGATVPTNLELWEAFKPYYNTYYGLSRADQPIDKVSTFAAAKMQEIMTDAASEYKWLGDYILGVAAGQGVNLPTDMAAANEGAWRWAVHAFFNATTGANGAAGTDFTEAGKPENWGPAYLAAKEGTTPEPEIEWIEMPLEITNLTTEVMEVEGKKYLQLNGRDDMNDADVMLFLNNYADVDDDYVVNAESSYMTFGGMELTVIEGIMTQTSETDKGTIYTGTVRASVEEEGETMYVEFALTMYAAPAIVIELTDAIVAINEELGTLTFNVPTEEGGYYAELAGYTAPGVHEGPQICLFETPEAVAFANYVETSVADGVITLKGEFTSFMGAKFDVTISGKLPVDEPVVELPAASVRAWAYDLALAVEGEQYTFSYKATTPAKATLIFTDAEGVELATKDLGLVEAGANTAVLAATELPAGKKVNWAIKLEAGAIAELAEVTDQSRGIYDFYNMMDVLVDNNPESEHFGKIYIQQSLNGASDGATDRADTQIAGFFVYDQALNELNPTSNVGIQPILPEGYTMGDARNKFHRLEIDPKTGNLTWCYNIAGQPAVFAVDPANLSGEAANLVAGIEGLSRTSAHCFDAEGALYVYDLPAAGSIFKIVDGVATEFVAPDSKWVQASATMAADGMGGLWVAQNRGQIDTYYQLAHYTKDGALDYAVYQGNENGFSGSSTRGALVYDAERQLLAQGRNGMVEVYSVAYNAETGVPALTLVATTPSVGTNIDGLAFDYAGDLYVVNSSKEKFQKFAMPTDNNVCTTPAAAKYAFEVGGAATPVEMVGVVKRALQIGESTVVLTHEANGTPHIYNIVDGEISEVSQEGVIARDPENLGDLLAISDIAATEDGKLVAVNYMICQSDDSYVDEGYKRGENRFYIWNSLTEDPTVWFTSNKYSNWFRAKQGYSIALRGSSQNAEIVLTGLHATKYWARYTCYKVVDGAYTEDYWFEGTLAGTLDENNCGSAYELNASPLNAANWIMDGELANPIEYFDAEANAGQMDFYPELASLSIDLGKKFNGASYVTVDEQVLMVAPYATAEGLLAGVKVLDITAGLASATEVAVVDLDAAVEATAAATAVEVVEGGLNITLVADATIYTLTAKVGNDTPDQGLTLTATGLETKLEADGSYTLQGLAVVNGDENNLMDFMLCVYPTEGYTDAFLNGWSVMIFGAPTPDAFVENEDGTFTYTAKIEDTFGDGTVYNINMSGTIKKTEGPEYMELDDQITNMTFDLENMVIYGGPSENYEIEVVLGLGEDNFDGSFTLSSESSVAIKGIDAEFVEGYVYDIDINAPSAVAVVKVNWDGMYYAFTLTMSATPAEATVVVVENATVEVEKYLLFGDTYDYALKMTGNWLNEADGLTYPVLVEVPVYYPESTEPFEMLSTVTVGGWGDSDPWLGFGEGTLTVTTVDGVVTATGRVENPMAGVVIDITISGKIVETALEDVQVTVKPVKTIKNGQLIITKDGKEYNAQGATVK